MAICAIAHKSTPVHKAKTKEQATYPQTCRQRRRTSPMRHTRLPVHGAKQMVLSQKSRPMAAPCPPSRLLEFAETRASCSRSSACGSTWFTKGNELVQVKSYPGKVFLLLYIIRTKHYVFKLSHMIASAKKLPNISHI